MTFKMVQLASV